MIFNLLLMIYDLLLNNSTCEIVKVDIEFI